MSGHFKPRSWFSMFWRNQGWFSIFLACATIVLTGISVNYYAKTRTVAQDGVLKIATVADRRIENTDADKQFFVTYVFTVGDGKEKIEMQVRQSDYEDAAGFIQKVYYPTDDPALIGERQNTLQNHGKQFRNLALLAGLAGLFMGWLSGRKATGALLARRGGIEEDAYIYRRVESISDSWSASVHIKFRSHSGAEGRSFSRSAFTFPALEPGDMIRVFTRNGRAWWVDDTGPRPAMPERLPKVRLLRHRWRRRNER